MPNSFQFRLEYQIPELWEQIASCCTPATLRNLSFVHRGMVDPSQRFLFEALAFRVRQKDVFSTTGELLTNSEGPYKALVSRTSDRFEALSTSHFAQYVRRWLCEGAIGIQNYDRQNLQYHIGLHHTHAVQAFITALPRYSLLNYLCLSRMEVNSLVLDTLPALKNLKTLHFHLVVFECQLSLPTPLLLEEFLVEVWRQDGCEEPNGIDTAPGLFFSPDQLQMLTMKHSPNGKSTLFFCNTLINSNPHTNLVELRFTIYDSEEGIALLVKLLKASPLLEILQIDLDSETEEGYNQLEEAVMSVRLEASTCRLIHDLACPATFAPIFAMGRPIRRFCMEVGDYYTSCPISDVVRSLVPFNRDILTDLNFEQTRTDNARDILPAVTMLFPTLQVLRMPMNDLADDTDTDDDQFDGIEPVDDRQIDDPDDMERERRQFESCYDDNDIEIQPEALLHFGEGYLRLLSDIAFGAIELPESLVKLDLPQTRLFKRLKFTKDHEIQLIKLFAMNRKWKDLHWLRIGTDNIHNKQWKKDSEGRWKKERYHFHKDGKDLVGTLCLSPTPTSPDSDQFEFSQTLIDVSEVVTSKA